VADEMRVYSGSAWAAAGSAINGTTARQTFTATAGQTTFTMTSSYDAGFADVYLNGVKLVNGVDVNVTSGTDVVLTTGAAAGDSVDVIAYGAFVLANHYTIAQADALLAAKLNNAPGSVADVNIAAMAASKLTGRVPDANAPLGSVIQVATATKTAKQLLTATVNTMNEMDTNFRVSMTPLSSSSRFLLFMHISGGSSTGCPRFRFEFSTNGGSSWSFCTPVGDADGNRTQSHCSMNIHSDGNVMQSCSAEILFSPNTTSPLIFRVTMGGDQSPYMMWNGSLNNFNTFLGNTMVSTLRVMEIAA